MSTSWHTYPKVYNLGHVAIEDLLKEPVIVEEKIDGSQFSFGLHLDEDGNDVLRCRSRGAQLNILAPDKMFQKAVNYVLSIREKLPMGLTFRAEYLAKPKHNSLAYDRVPKNNLIVFDVNTDEEKYMDYDEKVGWAEGLGLETVPILYSGMVDSPQMFRDLLAKTSVLGGQLIEGIVAKNYVRFGRDGKALMGKFVSEKFKEVHGKSWKERHPGGKDIIQQIVERYKTSARWEKGYQHLRDAGKLEHADQDIGILFKEVPKDIEEECKEAIKADLYAWAKGKIMRGVMAGMAEWYKEKLMERQFDDKL